jgi:energy-coupling factor transporter ATP-binding protein EcfA2
MGKTGAGKTTLCNMLCGTNHNTKAARGSVTQNLYQNPVNCGSYSFNLLDTPGTDSQIEPYKHAILLKEALTGAAINTVFFVIKYDSRFDNIIMDYNEIEVHWDQSKTPEEDFKGICDFFGDEHRKLANIIFYSERDNSTELANLMYRYVCNMKPVTLSITDEDFHLNFNIYQMQNRIQRSYNAFLAEGRKKEEEFSQFIGSIHSECQSVEDKDEILHMAIVKFKEEMENLSNEFIKTHGSSMQELDSYGFQLQMRKEIIKICNAFSRKVAEKMSYSLFDNTDPRNLIKKCPNCDEIWYKTEGCNGVTSCGNNGFTSYYDISTKPFWRFTLERADGTIRWSKVQREKRTLPAMTPTNEQKRKGCGTSFEWGKLPAIEDEKIKELFQVKTIEEAKQLIGDANYTQQREEYARSVDVIRYS